MVYRSSRAPKTGHYNNVLVISYSWQGHGKPEMWDSSSVNRSFSSRPFKARRKVLNNCLAGVRFRIPLYTGGEFWIQWVAL